MNEERLEKFRQIIERKEFASIITEFTLDERERLVELMLTDSTIEITLEYLRNLKMFTVDEVKKKLGNITNVDENYLVNNFFYLMSLSDNDKEDIVDKNLDSSSYIYLLILSINSDQIKLKYVNLNFEDYSTNISINSTIADEGLRKQNFKNMVSNLTSYEEKKKFIENCLWIDFPEKNAILREVSNGVDLEKIIKDLDYYSTGRHFVDCLLLDEKIKIISSSQDKDVIRNIVSSLSDDEKIKYIDIYFDKIKGGVIPISDTVKSKYINDNINNYIRNIPLNATIIDESLQEKNIINMISTLVSDEEKLNFMKAYLDTYTYSLKNKEIIRDLIKDIDLGTCIKFINESILFYAQQYCFVRYLSLDKQLQIIPYVSFYLREELIQSLSSDLQEGLISEIPFERIEDLSNILKKSVKELLRYYNSDVIRENINYVFQLELSYNDLIGVLQEREILNDYLFISNNIKSFLLFFSKKSGIAINKLQQFYDLFGEQLIFYLTNENIREILVSGDESFNKLIELFNSSRLNEQNFNTIYNSLVQIKFGIDNAEVFMFFNELNSEKNEEIYKGKIKKIIPYLNIDNLLKQSLFVEYINIKKYNLEYVNNNIEEIINTLMKEKIETKDIMIEQRLVQVLNVICNNYISTKRELYLKEMMKNIDNELNLPKIPVKDKVVFKVISELSSEELIKLFSMIDINLLTDEQKLLISNQEILLECIKFKKSPQQYQENIGIVTRNELLSRYLKIFNKLTEVLFNSNLLDNYVTENEMQAYIPQKIGEFGLQVLESLDYHEVLNNVLFTEKFDELKEIIKKYGFLGLNDVFGNFIEKLGLEFDVYSVTTLIEFYPVISKKIDIIREKNQGNGRMVSMKNYLDIANLYSGSGFFPRLLFGEENFEFFRKNPGPNAAHYIVGGARVIKAEEYISKMFKREYITVPPINEVISNNSGNKSLRVVVGDVTSMINFTYGERTGACMRIGGVADSLFDFAMTNDSGFHIRFEDPSTGEFVSRITCFRNGNTLFFNQLRKSTSPDYDDNDLCEICNKVANELVERTSNSLYPINNVIISSGIAMGKYVTKLQGVNFDNILEGYSTFYNDLTGTKYVLATSAKDKPYEEFVPGPDNAEKYPVLRSKVKSYEDAKNAVTRINQLKAINQLMVDKSLGEVEPLKNDEVVFAITGEDWYLYVDNKGNVQRKILDNLPESKRDKAQMELKAALVVINSKFNDIKNVELQEVEMVETIGGSYGRR